MSKLGEAEQLLQQWNEYNSIVKVIEDLTDGMGKPIRMLTMTAAGARKIEAARLDIVECEVAANNAVLAILEKKRQALITILVTAGAMSATGELL